MDTSHKIYPWHVVAASPADIAKMTTRHIHALFKRWRTIPMLAGYREGNYGTDESWAASYKVACEKLKAELDRRPHVPNKAEGKALRREAAKRGR